MTESPRIPVFGSREHLEWIARRLSKNLRLRRIVEDAERLIAERRRQVA
jgi:hypothetical protein